MAMACSSPSTVPIASIQTNSLRSRSKFSLCRSLCSHSTFFQTSKLGFLPVAYSVNEEQKGRSLKSSVQSKGRDAMAASSVRMAASAEDSSTSETTSKPYGVLFVCLGNICRSPSAEAVFRDVVQRRNLESGFNIDSAGTIDYHEGNPADSRMKAAAKKRGVHLTSISRPIRSTDFEDFDLILAMDKSNLADILGAYDSWNKRSTLSPNAKAKVKLMCSYCTKHKNVDEVPDPYYGGPAGFEKVLDLLEDACEGLLAYIQELQGQDGISSVKTSI